MSRAATGYFDFYLDGNNVDLDTRAGLLPRLNQAPRNASGVLAWSLSDAPEGTQADPRYRLSRGNPKPTPYPASILKTVELSPEEQNGQSVVQDHIKKIFASIDKV